MAKQVYEYVFDILFNIPSRKIAFKPYNILEFRKTCNYFTEFIPKYVLKCRIYDKDLNILRIFDKEITVNIRQFMFYGETREGINERKLISELDFACYYDKDTLPNFMNSAKTSSPNLEARDTYKTDILGTDNPHEVTFYLFLKKDLKMKTYIHNYIFGSEEKPATTGDAVMAICEQNPYVEKVLMDPPDNTESYTDLIVEPADIKDAIKNVQYKYGIYSKSLELFYDNGLLYILNKMEIYHVHKKGEIQTIQIRINERKDIPNPNEHALINTKKGYIGYERMGNVAKEDYESIEGIVSGNQFVYSNYGSVINSMFGKEGSTEFVSPLNSVEKPRPSRIDVGNKKILDYDMLNNPFNMSSYMNEISQGVPIGITVTSMNAEHFTPNKIIKMAFDNTESMKLYSGLYSIHSADFIYIKTNKPAKRYNCFGHVILKLVNKHEGFDKDYSPKKES